MRTDNPTRTIVPVRTGTEQAFKDADAKHKKQAPTCNTASGKDMCKLLSKSAQQLGVTVR